MKILIPLFFLSFLFNNNLRAQHCVWHGAELIGLSVIDKETHQPIDNLRISVLDSLGNTLTDYHYSGGKKIIDTILFWKNTPAISKQERIDNTHPLELKSFNFWFVGDQDYIFVTGRHMEGMRFKIEDLDGEMNGGHYKETIIEYSHDIRFPLCSAYSSWEHGPDFGRKVNYTPHIVYLEKHDSPKYYQPVNSFLEPSDLYLVYEGKLGDTASVNITLELVSEAFYNAKKNDKVDYLISETEGVQQENGQIIFTCDKGEKIYEDKPELQYDEAQKEYHYIGYFPFLNQYLLRARYWESHNYYLIDKYSCKEISVLGDYPYVSTDKDMVISLYANPYDHNTELVLYSIKTRSLNMILSEVFIKWMPAPEKDKLFWCKYRYFYLAVNHIERFWTSDGDINSEYEYIRIGVQK